MPDVFHKWTTFGDTDQQMQTIMSDWFFEAVLVTGNIKKVAGVDWANVKKVSGVLKANIKKYPEYPRFKMEFQRKKCFIFLGVFWLTLFFGLIAPTRSKFLFIDS